MKAIVFNRYGQPDVLHLEKVKKPSPRDNEVLIKVHAVSLNSADWRMLTGTPFIARLSFGLLRPMKNILGADIAGVVEAIGSGITRFKPGDKVYGDLGMVGFGGLAEYVCAPEHVIAPKPINLTYEESAALPMASITALQALQNEGQVQPGQKVLIHGSAGGVGTYAIQIAKYLGAEVTGVCSTRNIEQTLALGADHVIDYLKEDFAANGKTYDLILGINGNRSIFDYRNALTPKGKYLMIGGSDKQIYQFMLLGPFVARPGQKMGSVFAKTVSKELIAIKDLAEAGKIRPLIDRTYKIEETPEAMRYLGTGHAHAKIIIKVKP